jgi:cytochrome o ubiquinol oxidase subunit 3
MGCDRASSGVGARRSGLPCAATAEPERGGVHLSVGRGQPVRRHRQSKIPAGPRPVVVAYGFWLFLLSDIVLFSCLFAAHAVLQTAIADGPAGHELFKPSNIAIETACLLLSSFTCGMSAVACGVRNLVWTQVALLVTGLLGVAFLVLEANDFAELVAQGAGPQRSAFLSSFFAVVGCHGLHVSAGLLWLGTMMAQIFVKGFRADILRRMLCFNLFWHVLDIIWVALFTIVYLIGEGR